MIPTCLGSGGNLSYGKDVFELGYWHLVEYVRVHTGRQFCNFLLEFSSTPHFLLLEKRMSSLEDLNQSTKANVVQLKENRSQTPQQLAWIKVFP